MKTWKIPRLTKPKKYSKEYKGNTYTIFNGSSNYIWLLDAGHGGMIDGVYQTEGKRSPIWENGEQLFEGVSNRDLVNKIAKELENRDISYIILVDTEMDTPLKIRTDLANALNAQYRNKNKKCIYVSVHSDAFRLKSAKGWSVFTSPGKTLSDTVAEKFALKFQEVFPKERLRHDTTDGDLDKEAKFWVLTRTVMPAILTENFFMTNPRECKEILMNEEGRNNIAKLHYDAIQEIDDQKLIG
jgi:N-acetylmuramoyl-L-alanine amidase